MLRVLRMFPFSQAAIKLQLHGGALRRGVGGRSQTSSVFIAPSSPLQRRNPCLQERPAMVGGQAAWSRPFGATLHRCWVEQLGGAPAGAQSYWQGRFAACAFVERVGHTGRPRNSWGVAPNPSRDAVPAPCKGQTKRDEVPPLTRFGHRGLSAFQRRYGIAALNRVPRALHQSPNLLIRDIRIQPQRRPLVNICRMF